MNNLAPDFLGMLLRYLQLAAVSCMIIGYCHTIVNFQVRCGLNHVSNTAIIEVKSMVRNIFLYPEMNFYLAKKMN